MGQASTQRPHRRQAPSSVIQALFAVRHRMPDVPYYIMAGGQDPIPNFTRDIIRTVSRMKKRGLGVTFVYLETMGHCNSPAEETAKYNRFIYDRFGFPAEYDIYKGSTWEPK